MVSAASFRNSIESLADRALSSRTSKSSAYSPIRGSLPVMRDFPVRVEIQKVLHGSIELQQGEGARQSAMRADAEGNHPDAEQFLGLGALGDVQELLRHNSRILAYPTCRRTTASSITWYWRGGPTPRHLCLPLHPQLDGGR